MGGLTINAFPIVRIISKTAYKVIFVTSHQNQNSCFTAMNDFGQVKICYLLFTYVHFYYETFKEC